MEALARGGYTEQEVRDALHSLYGQQNMKFRYDLLDKDENRIGTLTNVLSGEVSCDSLAHIKRTAKFRLKDDGSINYLRDRIQPFVELKMRDGNYINFPMGIFLLSSPSRADEVGGVFRNIEAYDGLIILKEDLFTDRYTIMQGTNYRDAVIDILTSSGITKHNIEQTDKTLPTSIDFEPGKEKLFAINELLRQINYDGLKVDVNGYFTSSTYRSPKIRTSEYTYKDDRESVTLPGMEEELDLNIPNQWVVVRSNEEQSPLRSEYTNDNPDSPTSTVNVGRTIVDFRKIDKVADQQSLDAYTQRIAYNASQIYGKLTFKTGIMPMHDIDDVLTIDYSRLGIKEKYSETTWRFPLKAGGVMEHELRRTVQI